MLFYAVSLCRHQSGTKRCKTLSGHNVVEGKDFKKYGLSGSGVECDSSQRRRKETEREG